MVKFQGTATKLRPTDRFRGGMQFVEHFTNAKAGMIGFLTGRGYSSFAIAEVLDDGTNPGTVRTLWQKWGLHSAGHSRDAVAVSVPLSVRQRANLADRAAQHGLSLEEYCRRMLICGSMPKDRYSDLVPKEQFD